MRTSFLFFGACSGEPRFRPLVENMVGLLFGARDPIVQGGLLEPEQFDQSLDALRLWAGRPDAALWYAIFWAEGIRP
jgi:hypothetical protein